MSYTVEQIVSSAQTMVPESKGITPDARLAWEVVNDGLAEIQRRLGYYRMRQNVTCTADQNYVSWLTGAGDYLDLIKLVDVYNGSDRQIVTQMDKIKLLRSSNATIVNMSESIERFFAVNLYPDNATFGTVYIEMWPTFNSDTVVIVDYETHPPAVTASSSTVNAPRDCMLYYIAWRIALRGDDNKRIVYYDQRFRESCEMAKANVKITKTKHRSPQYGYAFANILQSRRTVNR